MIISTIYTFGIKGGVGVGRIAEHFSHLQLKGIGAVSESSIQRLTREIESNILWYKELEEAGLAQQASDQLKDLKVVLSLDETWLDEMLLVCQELTSEMFINFECSRFCEIKNKMNVCMFFVTQTLNKLEELSGLEWDWEKEKNSLDGMLKISRKRGGQEYRFPTILKSTVVKTQLAALRKARRQYENLVILGGKINPRIRRHLREWNMNYLDSAGNVYINTEDYFIILLDKKVNWSPQRLLGGLPERDVEG